MTSITSQQLQLLAYFIKEPVFRVGIFRKQMRFRIDASSDSIVEASLESVLEAI